MPHQYICQTCQSPFSAKAPNRSHPRLFCSKRCYGAATTTKIKRLCEICQKPFMARPGDIAIGWGQHCSRSCANSARAIPAETRFWALVDKNGPIPDHCPEIGPCWLWTGARDHDGYGLFMPSPGKQIVASRFCLELTSGPLEEREFCCHHCDNPPCVRPDHLFRGDAQTNQSDMWEKGRGKPARGSKHHHAKLTESDIPEIRRRYANGEMQATIGADYGVSQSCISSIVTREAWSHIA